MSRYGVANPTRAPTATAPYLWKHLLYLHLGRLQPKRGDRGGRKNKLNFLLIYRQEALVHHRTSNESQLFENDLDVSDVRPVEEHVRFIHHQEVESSKGMFRVEMIATAHSVRHNFGSTEGHVELVGCREPIEEAV